MSQTSGSRFKSHSCHSVFGIFHLVMSFLYGITTPTYVPAVTSSRMLNGLNYAEVSLNNTHPSIPGVITEVYQNTHSPYHNHFKKMSINSIHSACALTRNAMLWADIDGPLLVAMFKVCCQPPGCGYKSGSYQCMWYLF